MKLFIRKTFLFLILAAITVCISYFTVDRIVNPPLNPENTIFIWGDSQAYQGLNLDILRQKTGKKVYSAATHGAGVYDLLVFTDRVPAFSTVIITLSKSLQMRKKGRDANNTGLSLRGIYTLYKWNYTPKELTDILYNNLRPGRYFGTSTELYTGTDRKMLHTIKNRMKRTYSSVPEYLADKQAIYKYGLERLKEKDCKIILVEFPYHTEVVNELKGELSWKLTGEFAGQISKMAGVAEMDTTLLDNVNELMYDATHLNEEGASILTTQLINKLSGKQGAPQFHVFTFRN